MPQAMQTNGLRRNQDAMKYYSRYHTRVTTTLTIFLFFLLSCFYTATAQSKNVKPNIVLVFIDDMGWGDVSLNNPSIDYTPNFQWLARHGLQLTNFYVSQAVCTSSRASLLTGCYTNRLGLSGAIDHSSKVGLNPAEMTIADMLKDNGYHTAAFGKWHLGYQKEFLPVSQGFDEFYGIPYSHDMWPHHPENKNYHPPLPLYSNEKVTDTITDAAWFTKTFTEKSIDFINRNASHPFFLYLAHPLPHVPLFVSEKQNGATGKGMYADVINEIDWSIGEIMKTLRTKGLEENTLLIVTSDNGPWLSYGNYAGSTAGLREGKGTSWEGGVREPCVMYWKGVLPEGKVFNDPAMTIDILPTIAALTKSALPQKKVDGINIWPYLTGKEKGLENRPLFFYYNKNDLEAMRWKNWKLYFPHRYRTMDGQPPGSDGIPGKYRYIDIKKIELYDLSQDMYEHADVADAHQDIVKEMNAMADKIRNELGDDLMHIPGKENREPGRVQ